MLINFGRLRPTSSMLALAIAATAVPAYAQEVSSTISGYVQTPAGAPIAGASVEILHVPTGTRTRATSDADGRFSVTGLRVGGPFSVIIVANGYQGQTISDINTGAGDNFSLTAALDNADAGEAIVVTASRLSRSGILSTGSETTLSADDIASVVSAGRDIRDAIARDPLTSIDPNTRGISIAGAQARSNRFTIDGVAVQDDFGLNQGGLPSLRGIVSLEAIAQLSVKTAPYDVSQGNFTGGAIDAILKSGSNEYHAAAYSIIGGKGLTGRNIRGGLIPQALPFLDYGFFASGPIIKDKLFVALNYEKLTEGNQIITSGISGEGFANVIPNIGGIVSNTDFADDRSIVDGVIATSKGRYKYDPLNTFQQLSESDRKISGKVDWNIAEGQRLSFTYINHFNSVPSAGGGSSNSPTTPNVGLQSNSYETTEATKIYTGQLNSRWTDRFSTELRVSYRDYVRGQLGYGDQGFGQFQVCTNPTNILAGTNPTNNQTNCGNNARVTFGTDQFRQSNSLATTNLNFQLNLKYNAGDHRIKLQIEGARQKINNVFVPSSRGLFYFDSLADYNAGNANSVSFSNALNGDPTTGGAARFTLYSYAFGLQDEWSITPELTALIGARFDGYAQAKDSVVLNYFFVNRYGFRNTATLDGVTAFQPRLGLNWKPSDRLNVEGGVGIFSGGVPLVLFSNSLANDGARLNSISLERTFANGVATGNFIDRNNPTMDPAVIAQINAAGAAALNNVDGFGLQKNAIVNNYLSTNTASLANATTNSLDPNFRINSVLRINLNAQYKANFGSFLGDNWIFRGDVAISSTQNGYYLTDLRAIPNGTLPDGRPRYQGAGGSAGNDLLLTNTGKGYALTFAGAVSKEWENGFSIGAAYTRQTVKDLVSYVGNTTASGGYGVTTSDPNTPNLDTSTLQVRNQVRLTLNYRHSFYKDYETNFQIFGIYRAGRPFSYTFGDGTPGNSAQGGAANAGRGSVFGTTANGRYLIYVPNIANLTIPTGTASVNTQIDPIVQFSGTPAALATFRDFIQSSGLDNYQGQIAPRAVGKNPDFYTVNLHLSQQIPTFVGRSRLTVFADMENFLNLISDKFAFRELNSNSQSVQVVDVTCLSSTGTVVNSLATPCASYRYSNFRGPVLTTFQRQSLWTVRLGARLEF